MDLGAGASLEGVCVADDGGAVPGASIVATDPDAGPLGASVSATSDESSGVVVPTVSPTCLSWAVAASTLSPATLGTFSAVGPLETVIVTSVCGPTELPAAGVVPMTAPGAPQRIRAVDQLQHRARQTDRAPHGGLQQQFAPPLHG